MTRNRARHAAVVVVLALALAMLGAGQTPAAALVSTDPVDGTPDFNGTVLSVTRHGSTVYVGGRFTKVTDGNRTYTRSGAAAFDRRTGDVLPWNPKVSGTVHEILVARATVFIGGAFTAVGGVARRNLASVRASGDGGIRPFAKPVNGTVYALTATAKRIYVGGKFSRVDGKARAGLAALGRRTPNRLTAWRPKAEIGAVRVLQNTNSGIVVGGYFDKLNGRTKHEKLAKVNRRTGALVRGFNPALTAPVLDVSSDRRRIYVAGGGPAGGFVAAFARTAGQRRWLRTFDGDVAAVALSQGVLYVGGHFDALCDTNRSTSTNGDCLDGEQPRRHLAALQRSGVELSWNPGANSSEGVWELTAPMRRSWLGVGGAFTEVAGEPHGGLAVLR